MKCIIPNNSRLLKVFPELAFIDDPAERYVLWYAAFWSLRRWYFPLVILLAVLVVPLSHVVLRMTFPLLRELFAIPDRAYHRLFSIAPGIVSGTMGIWANLLILWLLRRRTQRVLRQQLLARGIPICLACGYDLRGQLESRCPECGTPFDPSLLPPCSP